MDYYGANNEFVTQIMSGASWSSGLIRLPTAPRVGGSNPGHSLSFIRFHLEPSREERKST